MNYPAMQTFPFILLAGLAFAGSTITDHHSAPPMIEWTVVEMSTNGRIDAIADLGNGVVLAGTRDNTPGHIYRSTDCGDTWVDLGQIITGDRFEASISSIATGPNGTAYILTGNGTVWKSDDRGLTWRSLGQVSNMPAYWHFLHAYSITVTQAGTLLVSNTNPDGGHIFRSTDGGANWENVGKVGRAALYRFEKSASAVYVNGWSGHIYRSGDDGQTWTELAPLGDSALYATDYLGNGIIIQGAEDGRIFRSEDHGRTWSTVAHFAEAGDDFVHFGDGMVVYSTYTGDRNLYLSADYGLTWEALGAVPSGLDGDIWDHVVPVRCGDHVRAVGGTKLGKIVIGQKKK